ncbi:hypothetical protein I79_010341 [Cricetulus griseus]|uniref:Uncharacterized protein n=1 Tax=Cricetulus griseus TaxID=10029 RepID=G3HI74_CRIGR|nr:hypothetical protein I79_010341 [Cricetulus griseus]
MLRKTFSLCPQVSLPPQSEHSPQEPQEQHHPQAQFMPTMLSKRVPQDASVTSTHY